MTQDAETLGRIGECRPKRTVDRWEGLTVDALYVGWLGHHNLGDDAMWEATTTTFDRVAFTPMPLRPQPWLRWAAGPAGARAVRNAHILLGGGTTIGRWSWRLHLRQAKFVAKNRPMLMWGAGVEDPRFRGRKSYSGTHELRRWPSLLREFDAVTVRGPQSARLLADVGVEARVVGDPALLCGPPAPGAPTTDRRLAVNLGFGDDLFGGLQDRVVDAMVQGLSILRTRDWTVRWIGLNPSDVPWIQRAAAALGATHPEIVMCRSAEQFTQAIGDCRLAIGQRLHAAVLAASNFVPPVTLEYQPKCRDFAESLGLAEVCLRTDELSAERIVEAVERLDTAYEHERERLCNAVVGYRRQLRDEAQRITGVIERSALAT